MWLCCFLVLAVLLAVARTAYRQHRHFPSRGIPQPPSWPLVGSPISLFLPRQHINQQMSSLYKAYANARYIGCHVFLRRTIVLRDPDLIKSVLVKNFEYFAERQGFVDEATDPLFGLNLNFLNGDRWREVRNVLSPAFTVSKLRAMYVLMADCAERFVSGLLEAHGDGRAVDMKDAFGRYVNDTLTSCTFGIDIDSLKEPENEFYLQVKKTTTFKGWTMLKLQLALLMPWVTRTLGMRVVSKEVTEFFMSAVAAGVRAREKGGLSRPDVLQLMLEARASSSAAHFDLPEMTAQLFLFFLAGFDGTTNHLCLMAQELAARPAVQARLRAEILAVTGRGRPDYEAVATATPYLDAVFAETLRLHPIAFLTRRCSRAFDLPAAVPGGRPYRVTPGTSLMVPVPGIHEDEDLYPEPREFRPERFLGRNLALGDVERLGFGLGPRMCIGNRFAILLCKTLLVHLLAKCSLEPCEKTCLPLEYCTDNFAPTPKGGFWLRLETSP